jgi:hypothetical protein
MLFLLFLPVVGCVALIWRYIQAYAPSNMLIRLVRSAPPRWRTVLALVALATVVLIVMHAIDQAVVRGAPGWLNMVVLVLAWDSIKIGWLALDVGRRAVAESFSRLGFGVWRGSAGRSRKKNRVVETAPQV